MEPDTKEHCCLCDIPTKTWKNIISEKTKYTNETICTRIYDIIGNAFDICFSADDFICSKCENILNDYEVLLIQIRKIRYAFIELLQKKYNLEQFNEVVVETKDDNIVDDNIKEDDITIFDNDIDSANPKKNSELIKCIKCSLNFETRTMFEAHETNHDGIGCLEHLRVIIRKKVNGLTLLLILIFLVFRNQNLIDYKII